MLTCKKVQESELFVKRYIEICSGGRLNVIVREIKASP